MGDPKFSRKKYSTPRKPWDKERIQRENEIKRTYGLKNKREIWRAKEILRKKCRIARKLLHLSTEERAKAEKELLGGLIRLGILNKNAVLDDVLVLKEEDFLERRLQTLVWRKGLAKTIKQARQFIVHGHITIDGKCVTVPGYLVPKALEDKISFYKEPIIIEQKPKMKIEKPQSLKEEFEEAIPKEEGEKIG